MSTSRNSTDNLKNQRDANIINHLPGVPAHPGDPSNPLQPIMDLPPQEVERPASTPKRSKSIRRSSPKGGNRKGSSNGAAR